jgi:hypothetical protein
LNEIFICQRDDCIFCFEETLKQNKKKKQHFV